MAEQAAPPTPRYSGTHASWPLYVLRVEEIIHALDQAIRLRMRLGIRYVVLVDIMGEAKNLRECFQHWEHKDPGDDLRGAAIAKLLDLREHAKEQGASI